MKRLLKTTSITLVAIFVSICAILFFLPLPVLLPKNQFSSAIYDSNDQLLRLSLSPDEKYRLFVPLDKIAPEMVQATLLQEDQYYWQHFGINPISLLKAVFETYVLRSHRMGASTITMQVARLRFGIHSKHWTGKVLQIIRAIELEMHYSKAEILEAYFNLAPYGNNIEGVQAASLIYFNKQAHSLNLAQALTLSVIPQNPNQRTPKNAELKQIRNQLYLRWIHERPADRDKKVQLDLPLKMRSIKELPFAAAHFVNHLLQDKSKRGLEQHSTLDMQLQKVISRETRKYMAGKKNLGAYNASVLLVDTRDMSVKAMLGSLDFFDKAIEGQINGTEIKRSPGSTLKPFIYGLALDQGLIHPNTVLSDVPRSFGSYNPENFDYDFLGPVKAKDALILSRNIPAIFLASQLKRPNLYQFLSEAGVSQLKPESYYGLALTLGGAELSMQELIGLYAALSNGGLWHPLRMLKDAPYTPGKKLISPEASFLVLDMLKDTPRPGFASRDSGGAFPVSWKTGTSSGYRDAWTVGVFGPYAMAVWIGNFNNKGNPSFIGKTIAAPLFFQLVESIAGQTANLSQLKPSIRPYNLRKIEVCKASGQLPTPLCQDRELSWFIPGKSPIKTDTIYREVAINAKTGLRSCHINADTKFEVYEFWPSDLLAVFKRAGIEKRSPPPYEPGCSRISNKGLSPQISSPQSDLAYIIAAKSQEKMRIPLTAVTDADTQNIYWFVNNSFLAKTKPSEAYIWHAMAGHYVVRVVDDHGLSDVRELRVRLEG